MTDLHFRQISVFGVGLLGGSLGLAVRRARLADSVVGVGHRESTLRAAKDCGAIDRYTLSPAEGATGADLLVLATPVGLFGDLMREAAPALSPGCLITDVGSTKRAVLAAVAPLVPAGCRFVGSHPLAGSEARGITASRDNLYSGALVLITPTPQSDELSVCRTEQFWQALGSRTRRLDAATHDRLLAQTSHLPHLIAAALVESLSPEAAPLVARGFLDTTRIASGDPAMWQEIFLTNRDELLAALDRFQSAVAEMKSALSAADSAAVRKFLDQAKQRRDGLLK
jgi:prephenate dehydrogenase